MVNIGEKVKLVDHWNVGYSMFIGQAGEVVETSGECYLVRFQGMERSITTLVLESKYLEVLNAEINISTN